MNPSYNNSFDSLSSGGTSGGTGDVILTASPVNKQGSSKKWVVIILLLLVIVGAGVGVGMWMMNKPNGGGGGNKGILQRYANYVINGDENNSSIGDGYVPNRVYYVANQIYNADEIDRKCFRRMGRFGSAYQERH